MAAACLGACTPPATPASPVVTPAKTDVAVASEAAPRAEETADGVLETEDGWVSVVIPGDDWSCSADHAEAHGVIATWVRCDKDARTYLLAKDYQVPPEQVLPARDLFQKHYANNYRRMFERFEYTKQEAVTVPGGLDAFEVALEGPRPDLGGIHMRERATVAGNHIALLTAHLPLDALDQAIIDAWFAKTRFPSVSRAASMRTAQRTVGPADPPSSRLAAR
jgi:hypothetical protein